MPATLTLTDALADELAKAVEAGVPIETAAQAAGISAANFYEWLQAGQTGTWRTGTPVSDATMKVISAFSERIRAAQARFEAKQLAGIAEAAEQVGRSGIREWRAGAWLLNNHPRYRERYRQHRETTVTQQGTVLHEHKIARELQVEALEAAYKLLEPDVLPPAPANEDA